MKLNELDLTFIVQKIFEGIKNEPKDVDFFANEYHRWNEQNGESVGYEVPTKASVLEFFQNNYEDYSNDESLKKELLEYLTNNDKSLSPFLQKLKELLVDQKASSEHTVIKYNKISDVENWPKIPNRGGYDLDDLSTDEPIYMESVDLENFEFMDITDTKLVFYAGGDWQEPQTITIRLVGDKLTVTDFHTHEKGDGKTINCNVIIKKLKADDVVDKIKQRKKEKDMKLNEKDLKAIITSVINESMDECQLDETTFEINPEDTNMQQKIEKIKGDSTLFNPIDDEIKIANESTYKKSDVLKMISEAKTKKKDTTDSYIKAIKKADRELDYELNGPGWKAKDKAHKDKKKYDRKVKGNDFVNEECLTKKDVSNMILEKKYNGKVYTKSELLNELKEN